MEHSTTLWKRRHVHVDRRIYAFVSCFLLQHLIPHLVYFPEPWSTIEDTQEGLRFILVFYVAISKESPSCAKLGTNLGCFCRTLIRMTFPFPLNALVVSVLVKECNDKRQNKTIHLSVALGHCADIPKSPPVPLSSVKENSGASQLKSKVEQNEEYVRIRTLGPNICVSVLLCIL